MNGVFFMAPRAAGPFGVYVKEMILWAEGVAFQMTQELSYALPLLCLFGVAVQIWPNRFGVLGAPEARKGWAAVMAVIWLFAAANFLLLFYVWKYHSRQEGFGFFFLAAYLGPSLILSLIWLALRLRLR